MIAMLLGGCVLGCAGQPPRARAFAAVCAAHQVAKQEGLQDPDAYPIQVPAGGVRYLHAASAFSLPATSITARMH